MNNTKLIRNQAKVANPEDVTKITDKEELNKLFALKIEELKQDSIRVGNNDINKFADLLEVIFDWAWLNGFNFEQVKETHIKRLDTGWFDGTVLTKLDFNNPSNKIYDINGKEGN